MVKRSIVLFQGGAVLLLAALLFAQLNAAPGAARRLDRSHPLWFMRPFRAEAPEAAAPAQQQTDSAAGLSEEAKLAEINRRSVLAPVPALNAVVAALEAKDLPGAGDVLIPGERMRSQAPPAPARSKRRPPQKAPIPGPIRLTGLTVSPTPDGATIRVSSSAPVARIALFTFTEPPRMVLELDGSFADYTQPIVVPPNQIFKSLTTERTQGKMRITGDLLTSKAYVEPVTTSSGDAFNVGMTLNPDGQPDSITR